LPGALAARAEITARPSIAARIALPVALRITRRVTAHIPIAVAISVAVPTASIPVMSCIAMRRPVALGVCRRRRGGRGTPGGISKQPAPQSDQNADVGGLNCGRCGRGYRHWNYRRRSRRQ
jgi:hypothetical protein